MRGKADIEKTTRRWQVKEKHPSQNFETKQKSRRSFLILRNNIDRSK